MKRSDLIDLLLLAALWGASFLFMRVAAPAFGPLPLAFVRVLLAALCLLPLLLWRGNGQALAEHWRPIALLGVTNSALPFALYGYAALTLPAGLSSVFNAATPLATALIGWLWLGDALTRQRAVGLAIGFGGVAGLALYKALAQAPGVGALPGLHFDVPTTLAIGACLAATLLYGQSANFARRHLRGVAPLALATGSQIGAAVALALPAALAWPAQMPGALMWLTALGLGLLCSALAYILYFRLLANVGATSASSVTFLVPVFATAWGALLLNEPVTPAMLAGGAAILVGTALTLGLVPRRAGHAA